MDKDASIINNENDDTDETEEDISNIEITGVDYSTIENHYSQQQNTIIAQQKIMKKNKIMWTSQERQKTWKTKNKTI